MYSGIPVDWIGELIVNRARPRAKDYNIIRSRVSFGLVAMLDRPSYLNYSHPLIAAHSRVSRPDRSRAPSRKPNEALDVSEAKNTRPLLAII